jgi:hypothetical protein
MNTAPQITSEEAADDPRFTHLINAAREFIAERIHMNEQNVYNDYSPEDLASAQREETVIETEIALLNQTTQPSSDSQADALEWLIANRRPGLSREAAIDQLRRALRHDPALVARLDAMDRVSCATQSSSGG